MGNHIELANFAISKIGCGYVYGATGQKITEQLIQQFAKDNPKAYSAAYITSSRRWIGKESYDCAGIVDAFCGINTTANNYYDRATTKGPIASMPDKIGVLVHMSGHVGVYIGNGEVVEARGVDYGVVKTKLKSRPWVRWSYCYLVDYSDVQTPVVVVPEPVAPVVIPTATRPINPYSEPTITLYLGKKGMTKDNVKWLQFELNWRYGGISIDGIFGKQTKDGVGSFQGKVGLDKDYNCGPLTRQALKTTKK